METVDLQANRGRCGIRAAAVGLVAATLTFIATAVAAHDLAPKSVRELVRAQGYKAPAPQGTVAAREIDVVVLGRQLRFVATEWRTFTTAEKAPPSPRPEPSRVALQGERPLLHRVTSARPDQRITILAERRPGSSDLFVLAVDLCPEAPAGAGAVQR